MPGNLTSANDSVVLDACHVKGTVRFALAWIAWTKYVESADQPLLVRLGWWHHEQGVASLRWLPWKDSVGKTPSSWWHLVQRASLTMGRRPVRPVATCDAVGAMTTSPPRRLGMAGFRPVAAVAGVTGYLARLACVSGGVL